ncbi:uncharacterized protein STEHIDRAFT_28260, partial [Stereum hirsutum FP-91666 SS1]|uniref:uncharacterized protein n=1 Tax=Stereum hirsutum (strain FP-91666) TaxID=721885 RepID=UPI0004449D12
PADIITYSYNKQMVYVTPGETYDQALDFAQEVYPELRTCPRECIHFKISVSVNGSRQKVRIGSRAWGKVLANLTRYEVVEI